MKRILYNASDTETFQRIVKTAKNGIFGGTLETMDYLDKCRWFLERYDCIIIFTRDEGAHTCGWWKIRITKDAITCQSHFLGDGTGRKRNIFLIGYSDITSVCCGASLHIQKMGSELEYSTTGYSAM